MVSMLPFTFLALVTLPMLCSAFWGSSMCYLMGARYMTWDNNRLVHYYGTCPAMAFKPCDPSVLKQIGIPTDFEISIEQMSTYAEVFGSSSTEVVIRNLLITIDGQTIRFGFDPVLVNGKHVDFPYYYPNKKEPLFALEGRNHESGVSWIGKNFRLKDGTKIMIGGCWYFLTSKKMDDVIAENSCGICGFKDGNVKNDLMLPNGDITTNMTEFFMGWTRNGNGNSNKFGVKKCPQNTGKGNRKCPPGQLKQAKKICDELINPNGGFKQCQGIFSTWGKYWYAAHHEACVQLACQDTGVKLRESACMKLSEVANMCSYYSRYYDDNGRYLRPRRAPIQVEYRRLEKGKDAVCPINCDKDMHFDKCARVDCIKTCDNPNPSGWVCSNDWYTYGCSDMCVCDEGLLWNGKRCVAPNQC